MAEIASVYVVFADLDEAGRIGLAAVEEGLAACVNILGPCRSIYRWRGKVETSDEIGAIFKTTTASADRLVARITELHSYDLPAIVVARVDSSSPYADWVADSVTG